MIGHWVDNPQCDRHPAEAAQIYVQIRNAFPQAKIIGPNLSIGGGSLYTPVDFVSQWRTEVYNLTGQYPDVAGYGLHRYHPQPQETLNRLSGFYSAMQEWGEGNKELWLTEFGFCEEWESNGVGGPNYDHIEALVELVNDLESPQYDFVDRYAYYTTRQRQIVKPGQPTPTPASWEICLDGPPDLYLRYSTTLSERGEAYKDVGLAGDN